MHKADQKQWKSLIFDELRELIDGIGSILRWLWTINLVAAIAGIIVHQYVGAAIAGISSIVSLLGAAASRRAKRTLEDAIRQCGDDIK